MFTIKPIAASGVTVNRPLTRLRKHFLGISFQEVTFERRGFIDGHHEAKVRLEQIGRVFLQGYHAALNDEDPEILAFNLDAIDRELSGFAYEGAAMGLTLLDQLSFTNRRATGHVPERRWSQAFLHDSRRSRLGDCARPLAASQF